MLRRGYRASKSVDLSIYPKELLNDWSPSDNDLSIIKQRIIEKISKKRSYYTYHRRSVDELYLEMLIYANAL